MADRSPTAAAGRQAAAPEVNRILLPSALGALGIELHGELLTRVVIVPKGRERQQFTPLGDLKPKDRSDFLDEVLGRFSEYLAGARRRIDVDYDLGSTGLPVFARRVLKEASRIRYGKTKTYQQIASAVGQPEAYRKVLSVLVANPLPIAVPCHRVVTSKSGVGSYIGGAKKKQWLLRMERKNAPVT